jgi:hypothetical protein
VSKNQVMSDLKITWSIARMMDLPGEQVQQKPAVSACLRDSLLQPRPRRDLRHAHEHQQLIPTRAAASGAQAGIDFYWGESLQRADQHLRAALFPAA